MGVMQKLNNIISSDPKTFGKVANYEFTIKTRTRKSRLS